MRPTPRILQGQALRELASSAIDLSDGLASDLGHVLKASGCGAVIHLDKLPISPELAACVSHEQALRWALSGGEDYELCFTVPEHNRGALDVALSHAGTRWTCIGQITAAADGIRYMSEDKPVTMAWTGYDHFE